MLVPIGAAGLLGLLYYRSRVAAGPVSSGPAKWRSRYFAPSELTVTSTGLANSPTAAEWVELDKLALEVLDPFRRALGPIRVTSGFRSKAVNTAVKGDSSSRHMLGRAADFKLVSRAPSAAAFPLLVALVKSGVLPVRQLILYHPAVGGHIHADRTLGATAQFLYYDAQGKPHTWGGEASRRLA